MSEFNMKIDGVDVTDYIAHNGLKWTRNDIDAPNSGRTMDGIMHRGRVGTKIKMEVTCRPLELNELHTVLNAILPQYVTVEYDDPMYGHVLKYMYSNNNSATYRIRHRAGKEYWTGVSFPLVEV